MRLKNLDIKWPTSEMLLWDIVTLKEGSYLWLSLEKSPKIIQEDT